MEHTVFSRTRAISKKEWFEDKLDYAKKDLKQVCTFCGKLWYFNYSFAPEENYKEYYVCNKKSCKTMMAFILIGEDICEITS
jgi:hypothetical protein